MLAVAIALIFSSLTWAAEKMGESREPAKAVNFDRICVAGESRVNSYCKAIAIAQEILATIPSPFGLKSELVLEENCCIAVTSIIPGVINRTLFAKTRDNNRVYFYHFLSEINLEKPEELQQARKYLKEAIYAHNL